jgi:hypothetical protein
METGMKFTVALILAGLVSPATAETALTAQEFDAYATGKTLTYSEGGAIFGIEQYLPGRRVRWAFTGDTCVDGVWYPDEAGLICFVYEHDPTPQCWSFFQGGNGLSARFENDPDGTLLSEVEQSQTPLICAGPDVGV